MSPIPVDSNSDRSSFSVVDTHRDWIRQSLATSNSVPLRACLQDLLRHSPVFTENCDLYPQRMRDVLNQRSQCIIVSDDVSPSRAVASNNILPMPRADLESLLRLYPAAARHLQLHL